MRRFLGVLAIGLIFLTCGCYPGITGKVVDAQTGKPIEGAVVVAEWSITKGFLGLYYSETYKVNETVTDQDGKFSLSGVYNPLVERPQFVIYKKGYIAWRNDRIFPSWKERSDFIWRSNNVYRLKRFVRGYLHNKHTSFITSGISGLDASSKLMQAHSWERKLAQKENALWRKKRNSRKHEERHLDQYTLTKRYKQFWKEVIQELYFSKREK